MIPVRSLNEQWIYVGMPGTGKSWAAREDAWAATRAQGGFMVAHDPTDSFDDPGVTVPHQRYKSTADLQRGVAAHGGSCVHVLTTSNGDDVLRVALALAGACMAQAPSQGGMFRPVYVYWDEAVAAGGMEARFLSPLWMDALGRRRRYGIAPVLTSQSTYFAHRSVLTLASRIKAFRLPDPADGVRLRAVGLPKPNVAQLAQLPDREYFELAAGRLVHLPDMGAAPPPPATENLPAKPVPASPESEVELPTLDPASAA